MKKTILCLVCTFFSLPFVLKAQITTDLYIPEWRVIDSFIVIKDSLAAEKHLSALNERAKKEHNAAQIVKTTLFKVTYRYAQMGFTEGYFEAINDLREATESASFPEKTVFKSLLGEVYRSFLKNNLNHVVSKDLRNIPKNDLRALSKDSIYALSTQWFIESAMDERTKTIPIGLFDALTKPNLLENDVYRPTLYDFLGHRAIEFLKIRPNEYSIYNRFDSYFARQYYRLPIESDSFIKIDLRRFEQSGKDSLDYFLSCIVLTFIQFVSCSLFEYIRN